MTDIKKLGLSYDFLQKVKKLNLNHLLEKCLETYELSLDTYQANEQDAKEVLNYIFTHLTDSKGIKKPLDKAWEDPSN